MSSYPYTEATHPRTETARTLALVLRMLCERKEGAVKYAEAILASAPKDRFPSLAEQYQAEARAYADAMDLIEGVKEVCDERARKHAVRR